MSATVSSPALTTMWRWWFSSVTSSRSRVGAVLATGQLPAASENLSSTESTLNPAAGTPFGNCQAPSTLERLTEPSLFETVKLSTLAASNCMNGSGSSMPPLFAASRTPTTTI